MFSKIFFLVAAVLTLCSAAPSPLDARSDDTYYITPTVKSPDSHINGASINASNGELYIGKPTTTDYCLATYPCNTFPNDTSIIVTTSATAAMNVYVPGGQILYVRKTGELGYTAAHAQNVPSDAYQTGFLRVEFFPDNESAYAAVIFHGKAWLACPVDEAGVYRVYAQGVPSRTDCVEIEIQAVDSPHQPQAYQYEAPYTIS